MPEETIPAWKNPAEEVVESSEISEMRRRRLEKFNAERSADNDDNIDLD